ncbi:N-6 DNA methylase [Streptomyces siamensis]|uniref:site-specific DNA-methyltransferase (adenine-specific) n=1 Tax=Streptomyces siamensis TaxID=1274986 RepID=A0ABP9JF66_9ACTN
MAKLTLERLERHLFAALDIVRGTTDATESRDVIFAFLLLKHLNDEFEAAREAVVEERLAAGDSRKEAENEAELRENYRSRGVVFLPLGARWRSLLESEAPWRLLPGAVDRLVVEYLEPAVRSPVRSRDSAHVLSLLGPEDNSYQVRTAAAALGVKRIEALIEHFGKVRLRKDDFAFPGLMGAAYEYLIRFFADSAGSKGGEFYTPRPVVRMMVELARPRAGMRIYDPCVGSGGLLVQAMEYVEEHGEDPDELFLAGQDANPGSCDTARTNLIFHGTRTFSLKTGDVLTEPQHQDRDFDLALSNPPFAMNYEVSEVPGLTERMPYGVTPERGKADLMFLQHMLDRVKGRGGSVVTVMPLGVLFREGAEKSIRERLLRHDLLEAVIGLAPNLFYGTGIPACVMVLRAPGQKAPERRGKVLFITADREFHAERAQNVLLPEHIEKIVSTFHAYEDAEGFARVVECEELENNDFSLTPHRYVDNTPPPEPQDIRAHLVGGVPVAEIEARKPLLDAYGIGVQDLFVPREHDPAYVDFLPAGDRPEAARLAELEMGQERRVWSAFEEWWQTVAERITSLRADADQPRTQRRRTAQLAAARADLFDTFGDRLLGVGLLERHAAVGALVDWWDEAKHELAALAARGFDGVVDDWVGIAQAMLGPEPGASARAPGRRRTAAERRQAYGQKAVAALAPDFLWELAQAERAYEVLVAEVKAAREAEAALAAMEASSEGDEPGEIDPEVAKAVLGKTAMRALEVRRVAARKAVIALEDDFEARLERARSACAAATEEQGAVLGMMKKGLSDRLEGLLARRRRELVQTYERWQEKYQLSFREIENQLYGTSEGMAQNNPWSQNRAWDLTADSARSATGRQQIAALVHDLIDAEKFAEGALAKLEFDELIGPLAVLGSGEDRVQRRPLGDVLVSARTGSWAPASETADGAWVIGPGNLSADGLDLSRLRRLDSTTRAAEGASYLEPGDVLLSAVSADQVFPVLVWQQRAPGATHGSHVLCLKPRTSLLTSHYLAAWLRLPRVQRQIYGVARTSVGGTTVLNAARLLDVEIELPRKADQEAIDLQAETLYERRRVRRRQLAKLRLLKETLTSVLTG